MPGESLRTKAPADVFAAFNWPFATMSGWSASACEDMLEGQVYDTLQRMQTNFIEMSREAFTSQTNFISNRIEEDFACAQALGECKMPDEVLQQMMGFYSTMLEDYQKHFSAQAELLQSGMSDNLKNVEKVSESAMEAAAEITKTAADVVVKEVEKAKAEQAKTADKVVEATKRTKSPSPSSASRAA